MSSVSKPALRRILVVLVGLLFFGAMLPSLVAQTVPGVDGFICNEIHGTVTDAEDGSGAAGVTVTAVAAGSSSLVGSPVTSDSTDQSGAYSLDVAEGDYVLLAVSTQYAPDIEVLVRVDCPGDPVQQDFQLAQISGVPDVDPPAIGLEQGNLLVTVRETLARGADITRLYEGATVAVRQFDCDNPLSSSNQTDENGRAGFELDEGTWCVEIDDDNAEHDPVTVTIDADEIETIEMEYSKINPRTLEGEAEFVDSNDDAFPIENTRITVFHPFYCPNGEPPNGAEYDCTGVTDEDGEYEIGGSTTSAKRLPWASSSDAYEVRFEHDFFETRWERSKSIPPAIPNPPSGPPQLKTSVDLVLDRSPSSVSGDVGTGVHKLRFEGHFTKATKTTTTDGNGKFIVNLQSDAYRVTILDGETPIGWLCLGLRAEARELGSFTPDGQFVVGEIFDENHTAEPTLGGALLKLTTPKLGDSFASEATDPDECYIRTDSNGQYAIGLHSADYTVDVSLEDWQDVQGESLEVPGDGLDVGLARETGTIKGDVTDNSDGSVVEDVAITCTNIHVLKVTEYRTTTDADGEFEFTVPWDEHPDASDGENAWECKAEHEDFYTLVRDTYNQGSNTPPLNVGAGNTRTINFELDRRFWYINGTVRDIVSGERIENANVCGKNLLEGELTDGFTCDLTDADGEYVIGPFEIQYVEDQDDPVILNPVLILATNAGYVAAGDVTRIGQTNSVTEVHFELIPEDIAQQTALCLLGGPQNPQSCLPAGLDEADPENPNWVFGAAGVNEELNCAEAPNWNAWLGQTLDDPQCES